MIPSAGNVYNSERIFESVPRHRELIRGIRVHEEGETHGQINGIVDLSVERIARMNTENNFTAPLNFFRTVRSERYITDSDPLLKSDMHILDLEDALHMLRNFPSVWRYRHRRTGAWSVGFRADCLPDWYVDRTSEYAGVDYISVLSHMWPVVVWLVGIQEQHRRWRRISLRVLYGLALLSLLMAIAATLV